MGEPCYISHEGNNGRIPLWRESLVVMVHYPLLQRSPSVAHVVFHLSFKTSALGKGNTREIEKVESTEIRTTVEERIPDCRVKLDKWIRKVDQQGLIT